MIIGFETYVDKLKQLAKKFEVKTVESKEFPPCIKHAIEVLEKGETYLTLEDLCLQHFC